MNVKYNFTYTGGFPFDQNVLNDVQNGILNVEAALCGLLGPLVIISGCVVSGGTVSAGIVAINGELLPFTGGTLGTNVIPVEVDTSEAYETGTNACIITRIAQFGDDGVHYNPWSEFVTGRLDPWQSGDIKEISCNETYITNNFDSTGLGKNLRLGWAICNGNNGTPDKTGSVTAQRKPGDANFGAMGAATAGAPSVTLSAANIPELETENIFNASGGSSYAYATTATPTSTTRAVNVNAGSPNTPVSVIQQTVTGLFIMKL